MSLLYRFAADGRFMGTIVQDRSADKYAARMGVDLTDEAPPDATTGNWPYRLAGAWVLQVDPLILPPPPVLP